MTFVADAPAPEQRGEEPAAAPGKEKQRRPRRRVVVAVAAGVVIGGLAGIAGGYAIGSAAAREDQAQTVADLRADLADQEAVSSSLENDKAALESSLTSAEDRLGACQVAAQLGIQIIENRQEALDVAMDPSLPDDPLDPAWEAVGDQLLVMDSEFTRLMGQFDVASAVCLAPVGSDA